MLEMFILLSVVGAFAGLLAGLFGVGGGMVLVPAFFYSFTGLGYAGDDTMQSFVSNYIPKSHIQPFWVYVW